MSDLEQRVTEALVHGAENAPAPAGLAEAARARAGRKRRARIGGVGAVLALCLAVPAAVVATRGSDDSPRQGPSSLATDGTGTPGVPAGFRAESWHSVTVLVPDSWGWGSLSDWCADGGTLEPRVQRPGAASLDILCSPASTYGITFQAIDNHDDFEWPVVQQDPKSGYPKAAYVGGRGIGGVLVMVIAPTRAEGLDVLATMRTIGPEGDPNGCTTSRAEAPPTEVPDGVMRICRYDEQGLLEQSETVTGPQVDQAAAALEAAPAIDPKAFCPGDAERNVPVVRLHTADIHASVDLGGDCARIHGLGPDRQLTSNVLYWALSPGWSGSVPGNVPLPEELRRH